MRVDCTLSSCVWVISHKNNNNKNNLKSHDGLILSVFLAGFIFLCIVLNSICTAIVYVPSIKLYTLMHKCKSTTINVKLLRFAREGLVLTIDLGLSIKVINY